MRWKYYYVLKESYNYILIYGNVSSNSLKGGIWLFELVELDLDNWPIVSNTGDETLHGYSSGLPEHRALWVSRVILKRWSWNGKMLCWKNGERLCTFIV